MIEPDSRLMIIYNPLAGPLDLGDSIQKVAHFWEARGWVVRVEPTGYPSHATELARGAAQAGYHMVLAGGGDGTLGEVANGLANTETIMAPLPMGTGNSFAKELHMPIPGLIGHQGLIEASAILAAGRVQRMDLGHLGDGRYWLLWAGTGIDGYLTHHIEPRSKRMKRLGAMGYAAQSLYLVPRFPGIKATVQVDDQLVEGDFMMITVCNARYFAGGLLNLNPEAALDDGLFDVWLIRGRGLWALSRIVVQIKLGRHHDQPDLLAIRGRQISITTPEPTPFHSDGDPRGETPFVTDIADGALRVLIPPTAPPGLFQQEGLSLGAAVGKAQDDAA